MNTNTTASATLITTGRVTRAQLAEIETPAPTKSWTPVPHAELVDRIEAELTKRGVSIVSEDYGVQRGGRQLFGIMVLSMGKGSDQQAALGLRAANDKTMSIKLAIGSRVFVCENMCFSGDQIAVNKKHSGRLNLPREIEAGLSTFEQKYLAMSENIDAMKRVEISDENAKLIMFDAIVTHKLIPITYLPDVSKEYFSPTFREHQPGTLFSLNQAFTYALRDNQPNQRIAANLRVGKYFGLHSKAGSEQHSAARLLN